ncbi:HEXXH motif domain-containing protein [Saccharopolyspora flava]|uniref:HEXXH motif domain-containing protein n=1 Tax=Saccharopolyspora flava TaxID=95161 RepID=UPI0011149D6A|nr:HEXXH motif domain-containing protein [Saccharopolyspora flava]
MSSEMFAQVCDGTASESTIARLAEGELSRRLLQLRAVLDAVRPSSESFVDVESAWGLIERAEERSSAAVREILMAPEVGVWLRHVLHGSNWDAPVDLGYLHLVAGSVAMRAGIPFTLAVPVLDGRIVLPALGWIRVSLSFPVAVAELRGVPGGAELRVLGRRLDVSITPASPLFTPAQWCVAGPLSVRLSDHDPYREFEGPNPARPLGAEEQVEWAKVIESAWEELNAVQPERGVELAACLTTVVPMEPDAGTVGASSRGAFGAVALSPPRSADLLAEVLLHELQHNKLNALMNLVDLAVDDGSLFYAPWRPDPRPLPGLLHGVYAFAAVVEFWAAYLLKVPEAARVEAETRFAHLREQLRRGLSSIESASGLTAFGRRLVAGVDRRLTACDAVVVSSDAVARAVDLVDRHHRTWRSRNG